MAFLLIAGKAPLANPILLQTNYFLRATTGDFMAPQSFRVEVQKDYLNKLAQGQPAQCLAELIWNALDAESTQVKIDFVSDELGVQQIRIKDNGHGMWYEDAQKLFSALGGSWKSYKRRTDNKQRFLHGQEGKGRFKAFGLAHYVEWLVVCESQGGFFEYAITGSSSEMDHFHISEMRPSTQNHTGVTVILSDLDRAHRFFETEAAIEIYAPVFAQYLGWYEDVEILINGKSLTADQAIEREYRHDLGIFSWGGGEYSALLHVIEWKGKVEKGLYFSNEHGFPLDKFNKPIKLGGARKYSAYLCSAAVTQMFNSGVLPLHEMDEAFSAIIDAALNKLREHFAELDNKETMAFLDDLKSKKIYPYTGEAKDKAESKRRKIFDKVVVDMRHYLPEFVSLPERIQSVQLHLIYEMLESAPDVLQRQLPNLVGVQEAKLKSWKDAFKSLE